MHDKESSTWISFKRFLCHTVTLYKNVYKDGSFTKASSTRPDNSDPSNTDFITYGRHQLCFYLDEVLIAVLVQDHMPSGVISVYFMYNPVFSPLNLGKTSILIEMDLLAKK